MIVIENNLFSYSYRICIIEFFFLELIYLIGHSEFFFNFEIFILKVVPESKKLLIRTEIKLPKLGLMLVGWGGNNGTTITAALLANKLKLSWETKEGVKHANW